MTDRELVERAAKASGYSGFWVTSWEALKLDRPFGINGATVRVWNPIKNDLEALRLSVKMNFSVIQDPENCLVTIAQNGTPIASAEWSAMRDQLSTTRYAITLAASNLCRT